jgi:hypothetical protein
MPRKCKAKLTADPRIRTLPIIAWKRKGQANSMELRKVTMV